MKHKGNFNVIAFFPFINLIVISSTIFAQTEKFDIASFPSLNNWKKEIKEGMVTFSDVNPQTGTFGIISFYASTPGSGNHMTDFNNNWEKLVVGPFNADKTPANLSEELLDGWNTVTGVSQAEKDGVGFYIFLTVFSGYGKSLSIISLMNDQSYITSIDKLLRSIKLDKTELINNPPTNNYPDQTLKINISEKGGTETFDNFIYRIPEGWTSKQETNFMELFPQKVKPEEVFSIILLNGKTSNASLEQELATCWDEFAGMMKAEKLREISGGHYDVGSISKTFAGWEYITGQGGIRTGADFLVQAYVIRVKERVERVIVLAKVIRLDGVYVDMYPTIHGPYYGIITDFIFNLRFSNFNSPDLKLPTLKGSEITGVWAGIGFMGGKLKTTYAIFFSNGQVYYGSSFPGEGLHGLNTYVDRERTPRYWGTYTLKNGQGTVSMPSGSFPIRMEDGKLVIAPISEDHKFIRMPPVDDVKLHGIWRIQGQDNEMVTIRFNEDGSFTDNGALRVLDHSVFDYYRVPDGGGSGKYIIRDYSILFRYNDGRVLNIAFPGKSYTPGDLSPKELVLSFNEDILLKH